MRLHLFPTGSNCGLRAQEWIRRRDVLATATASNAAPASGRARSCAAMRSVGLGGRLNGNEIISGCVASCTQMLDSGH